ncbi:MAG: FkbM family methyltransferase [Bdellovibrionales bacterium]
MTFKIPKELTSIAFRARFFWRQYEREEALLINQYLPEDAKVLELGGCIGIVSCLINSKLADPEKHVVLEARPDLIPHLLKNRDLNGGEFKVVNKVLSNTGDKKDFYIHNLIIGGSAHRQTEKKITVECVCLNQLIEEYGVQFNTLVFDIEGGELELLRDLKFDLGKFTLLVFEIHSFLPLKDQKECFSILEEAGFRAIDSKNGTHVWKK